MPVGWARFFSHPRDPPLGGSHPIAQNATSEGGALLPPPRTCHLPTHAPKHETSMGTAETRQVLAGEVRAGLAEGRGALRIRPVPVPYPRASPEGQLRQEGRGLALPDPSNSRCLPQLPIQIKTNKTAHPTLMSILL